MCLLLRLAELSNASWALAVLPVFSSCLEVRLLHVYASNAVFAVSGKGNQGRLCAGELLMPRVSDVVLLVCPSWLLVECRYEMCFCCFNGDNGFYASFGLWSGPRMEVGILLFFEIRLKVLSYPFFCCVNLQHNRSIALAE